MTLSAGCKLVDQRTFERAGTAPSADQLAHADLPPLPLLVVSFADPNADWRPDVQQAVLAADAHTPGAKFEVVTPIPIAAGQDKQDEAARAGAADAKLVSLELQSDGVPPDRIIFALRGDPGTPAREVRLYLHPTP